MTASRALSWNNSGNCISDISDANVILSGCRGSINSFLRAHDSGDECYDTGTDKTFSSPGWIGGNWQHPSHVTCALCCGPRTNNNCRNWDYFGDWNLILSNTYILYLFIFYHLQIYNRTSASSCSNHIIIFCPQSSNHLSAMRCPALSLH